MKMYVADSIILEYSRAFADENRHKLWWTELGWYHWRMNSGFITSKSCKALSECISYLWVSVRLRRRPEDGLVPVSIKCSSGTASLCTINNGRMYEEAPLYMLHLNQGILQWLRKIDTVHILLLEDIKWSEIGYFLQQKLKVSHLPFLICEIWGKCCFSQLHGTLTVVSPKISETDRILYFLAAAFVYGKCIWRNYYCGEDSDEIRWSNGTLWHSWDVRNSKYVRNSMEISKLLWSFRVGRLSQERNRHSKKSWINI